MVETCTDIIRKLEERIKKGERLIMFDHEDVELLRLIMACLKNGSHYGIEIWTCSGEADIPDGVERILRKDMDEILETYHLYDFSDRIMVVSDCEQYGSLFNYVKAGILTKQEMADALLYNI